jgi:hypothetical protein
LERNLPIEPSLTVEQIAKSPLFALKQTLLLSLEVSLALLLHCTIVAKQLE